MKRINIRAVFLSILLITGLVLAGCRENTKEELKIEENVLQENIHMILDNIIGSSSDEVLGIVKEMDKADLDMVFKQNRAPITADAFLSGIEGYRQILDEAGDYVKPLDFDFSFEGNKIHVTMLCEFEKREVKLNAVLNKKGMIETVSFSPEYSLEEIAKKAGMNTVIGMGTVFIILAFIAFIISLFKFIPNSETKKKEPILKKMEDDKFSAVKEGDTELIAVITSAIVEYENLPNADGFVVREIVRRADNKW